MDRMDCNPRTSLAFLYKTDPFYTLCLSDLMTAPQYVTNQFLKEQRNLTASLKKIDHCQLSRMAQLNEEKKQFTLQMRRRLAPRASRLSTLGRERETRSLSTNTFSDLSSVKSSIQSFESTLAASRSRRQQSGSMSSGSTEWCSGKGHMKDSQYFFVTLLPSGKDQHGKTPKLIRSCYSALHSENIGKTINRAAYRVK